MESKRWYSLDALRTLAMILMIQQHLGPWLWEHPWTDLINLFKKHPIFMGINSLGGVAAPIFIILSGIGFTISVEKGEKPKSILRRGVLIFILGVILNHLSPSWFIPESWYVLHLIGFGTVVSLLFFRFHSILMSLLAVFLLVVEGLFQQLLETPVVLTTTFFRNYGGWSGILRYAFVEGHFPIFPWYPLFILGIIVGRLIINKSYTRIAILGVAILAGSLFSAIIGNRLDLWRYFQISPNFYPTNLPIMLFLSSVVLFLIVIFIKFESWFERRNFFTYPGRLTLTILFVHIVLFKEVSENMGYYKIYSMRDTFLIISMVLVVIFIISYLWSKLKFFGSLEWIIRKMYGGGK